MFRGHLALLAVKVAHGAWSYFVHQVHGVGKLCRLVIKAPYMIRGILCCLDLVNHITS